MVRVTKEWLGSSFVVCHCSACSFVRPFSNATTSASEVQGEGWVMCCLRCVDDVRAASMLSSMFWEWSPGEWSVEVSLDSL